MQLGSVKMKRAAQVDDVKQHGYSQKKGTLNKKKPIPKLEAVAQGSVKMKKATKLDDVEQQAYSKQKGAVKRNRSFDSLCEVNELRTVR